MVKTSIFWRRMSVTQHQNVLFNQLESYRHDLLAVVEGLSNQQANIIPQGFHNNVRWNLGHVYLDQFLWIEALTKERTAVPERFNQWFGFGTSPKDFTEETPSFEELKHLLKTQPSFIKHSYQARLDEVFEPIEMGIRTIEEVLVRTIFHEGMHVQAIMDLRKFITE